MTVLKRGDFVPTFVVPSSISGAFHLDTVAGHRICLVFLGDPRTPFAAAMCERLLGIRDLLNSRNFLCFPVIAGNAQQGSHVIERVRGAFAVFLDEDGTVHARYGQAGLDSAPSSEASRSNETVAGTGAKSILNSAPAMFVIRENMRLHRALRTDSLDACFRDLAYEAERFHPFQDHARAPRHAPVLVITEVFDRSFCLELKRYYASTGGGPSGFMRDVNGMTRALLDPRMKRRKDISISDMGLQKRINNMLWSRIRPEIQKAFSFETTRIERYLIGCYEASDQGFFSAHRDNTSKATRHRRFAVSINLNADEFEGGELWFPEYSRQTYKPATGEAVVFSCYLLHEARPVTEGTRLVFLPFLYDDAAAQIRRENIGFLDTGPAQPLRTSA